MNQKSVGYCLRSNEFFQHDDSSFFVSTRTTGSSLAFMLKHEPHAFKFVTNEIK